MDYLYLYVVIVAVATVLYLRRDRRMRKIDSAKLEASVRGGMVEPPSLHPLVDHVRCIGSGACVKACPEQALGIVGGKAVLVNAAACIGHGACRLACPVEAIGLVFGSAKRGVDIPEVSPEFESNVPGIFIAGELGGMGLIRKACEQGRQAIDSIRKRRKDLGKAGHGEFDVVIVGAGPAGFSAGLAALQHRLRYKLIEQEDSLGGAVYHYPRQKVTMSAPVRLALIGKVKFGEFGKEKLLQFWLAAMRKTGLKIAFRERMEGVTRVGDAFVVRSTRGEYRARSVLLALGRRGTPRKLGVPGEESAKVVYRLIDPAQFASQAVLIVGGGDSALEAAIAVSQQSGSDVTISYRRDGFSRANPNNRHRLEQQQTAGRVRVVFNSTVKRIHAKEVELEQAGGVSRYRNDAVIVCAGGALPIPLLQEIGIHFDTKFGTA